MNHERLRQITMPFTSLDMTFPIARYDFYIRSNCMIDLGSSFYFVLQTLLKKRN